MKNGRESPGYPKASLTFHISDMTCDQCERNVERALMKHPQVDAAVASSRTGWVSVRAKGESSETLERELFELVSDAGYTPARKRPDWLNAASLLAIAFFAVTIADALGLTRVFQSFPAMSRSASTLGFFVLGLLTSVHCVTMCGGIAAVGSLSSERSAKNPLLYNLGRLVSYSLIGGLLGALGSAVALSVFARAGLGVILALLMVLVGATLTGFVPVAGRLSLRLPAGIRKRLLIRSGSRPLALGLLNGLMPCGPLQAMQAMALIAGGAIAGASAMFAFCLGTIPLMLAFSLAANALSSSSRKAMTVASGALVMMFGFYMLSNNLAILGAPSIDFTDGGTAISRVSDDGATQEVRTELASGSFPDLEVIAGIPVRWTVHAANSQLNGCNGEIVIRRYGVSATLHEGDNLIEFTPEEPGEVNYSCWMGMIRATIRVVER